MGQSNNKNILIRRYIGEIPLLRDCTTRLRFREILSRYITTHGNEKIPAVDSLLIMVYNIACGRQPVYELEHWATRLGKCILPGNGAGRTMFNDDRFGRALDKLYNADRASLMTEIAVATTRIEQLDLSQIHNDSTTVKAYGHIGGKTRTGLFLARGNSKDYRPDLKQLVYSLTTSADGSVPIHYKAYPGNRTDDTTHIETWNTVSRIAGRTDFLYVADCKLCTDEQLAHIVNHGGRVLTIMPETWKEASEFKDALRKRKKARKIIWRREIESHEQKFETFSCFSSKSFSRKKKYRIFWIHSSEKRIRDKRSREALMRKTEQALAELNGKLNKRTLKKRKDIQRQIDLILKENGVERFFAVSIATTRSVWRKQKDRGRPCLSTKYVTCSTTLFTLHWHRQEIALRQERNIDGIFPLLCTDNRLSAKEALKAYKYQPRLEKRFAQSKNVHNAAPLLFKKIERVEAMMFLFFLAMILQSVIERDVRNRMKQSDIDAIPIYPEDRLAVNPTTAKIISLFRDVSMYTVMKSDKAIAHFRDDLTEIQVKVLQLLSIDTKDYWRELFTPCE